MHPASFDYFRAGSVDEAVSLLSEHQGAKLLAGGHSLLPMLKLRLAHPAALIDIGRIEELRGIVVESARVTIGPLTTHAELEASSELQSACPLLVEAASQIGDPQVRNKGTVGGNIAHADPASDLPAVLVALSASIHLRGPSGERRVDAADFFVDLLTTAVAADEIVTGIEFARPGPGCGSSYLKLEHPASGYAVCGAAALIELNGKGVCRHASLCFNGVSATPYAASAATEALAGSSLEDETIDAAIDRHVEPAQPLSDTFASAAYRAQLAKVYGRRALKTARDRAVG